VAVQRADADLGPPGDVLQRRVRAFFRECRGGRGDQPGTVLPRVGAQLLGRPR